MATAADWYPKDLQSRARANREQVFTRIGLLDKVYCLNCGCSGGHVTCNTESILYLCRACAERTGGLPLPQLTQEDLDRIHAPKEG